ncbi:MAG: VTT domain-containing protein [Clostridiales bacterium]|nr:VTT domain-containing protein [Clostridiales bacterium]
MADAAELNRIHRRYKILNTISIIMLSAAAALFIWTLIAKIDIIRIRYEDLQATLLEFEVFITSLPRKWLVILAILLVFALKCFVPIIPLSAMFIMSGMVFKVQYATLINIAGFILLMSIRYAWGCKVGSGQAGRLLKKSELLTELLKLEENGNGVMLFLFRLIPVIPVNTVSQLYGSLNFNYEKYLLISLLGFAPRIISYSVIGRHVYDPFSVGFLLPIIILLLISGIALLIFNIMLKSLNLTENSKRREEKNG